MLKGNRIVVPASMRNKVLQAIYLGHQGENKSVLQARESVFWPSITTDIRWMVKTCEPCNKHQPAQPKLPILQPDLPTRPWEKLGTDNIEVHVTPSAGSNFPLAVALVHSSKDARIPNIRATRPPQLAEASPKGSTPTPDQLPHSKLPCREKQADLEPVSVVATSERTDQPKSQVTRAGHITRVPTKFKD